MANIGTILEQEARKLNQMVQSLLAPHLFFFCNFNAETITVFGADAHFFVAVNDMYKFLIDSSICTVLWKIDKNYRLQMRNQFARLQLISDRISDFRTALDHSLSEESGTREPLEKLEQWLTNTINKAKPTCEADYNLALAALEADGLEACSIIQELITKAAASSDKHYIVNDLERMVINYYKKDVNRNKIEGQIKKMYKLFSTNSNDAPFAIGKWIEDQLFRTEYSAIAMMSDPTRNMPNAARLLAEVNRQVEQKKAQIKSKLISNRRPVNAELAGWDYFNYLQDLILDEMQGQINSSTVTTTLLPQDIMQEIIVAKLSLNIR